MLKQIIKISILAMIAAFLIPRCATVSTPQGGPRDSLPPRIISSDPLPYAVNFNGKKLTITFNEYIQLKDQQKIFFMSPAPMRKPSLSIKGRSLVAEFRDTLEANTTYRLDFGGAIVDNNESNKLDGYTFIFSTGSYIDSLMMAGQVVDAFTQDTVIGAFINYFDAKVDSVALDSLMFNSRAEAVFRTDSSGYFVADILKEKPYRVYAFQDNNGDQKYQAGTDLVAFTDTVFNPAELPSFALEFDSTAKRTKIDDMQVRFELFKENARQRQNLISHKRTGRNKLEFAFASPEVYYDSLIIRGIDTTWLIKESNKTGDSITLWIAPPTKELFKALPDSIDGTFVYQRQDSVFQFVGKKEKLTFFNKTFVEVEAKKPRRELAQKESAKRNSSKKKKSRKTEIPKTDTLPDAPRIDSLPEFAKIDTLSQTLRVDTLPELPKTDTLPKAPKVEKTKSALIFKVEASQTLNPERGIGFAFDFPLRSIDSRRVKLTRIEVDSKSRKKDAPKIETNEKFTFDSISLSRYVLRAPWVTGAEYELMIPDSVFTDITFETNDTLSSKFAIANPEKFGTITLQTAVDHLDKNSYILELTKGAGDNAQVLQRKLGVKAGDKIKFQYIDPDKYSIRIIQDTNHNGKWDTGVLTERKWPEKVRVYHNGSGSSLIETKENWEIVEKFSFHELFGKR